MQLRSLSLNGFRRFTKAWVDLDASVIAIVGPNEAGKSSVLEALRLSTNDEAISPTALSAGGENHDEVIQVRFRLTDEERASLGQPIGKQEAHWLIVAKPAVGPRRYRLDPFVVRLVHPRRAAHTAIDRTLAEQSLAAHFSSDLAGELRTLRDALDNDQPNLSADTLALFTSIAQRLGRMEGDEELERGIRDGAQRLHRLLEPARIAEERPSSDDLARSLADRVPLFLDFNDEARTLNSDYDLAAGQGNEAFQNLLRAGGIEYGALLNATKQRLPGPIKSILDGGEQVLAGIMRANWGQETELRVGFVPNSTVISLTVTSRGSAFHALADRSDGLRSFIALRAFLAGRTLAVPPILLVDEAETHLHYDAQADLARMFEQQRDAAAVIYTTHSIGCLPQDLGRGVRAVIPAKDGLRSTIENAWTRTAGGISPLMRAMGAVTIPLAPARHVVIGEGPSDPVLLPSLLREVNGLRALPFQVVGRLSEASEDELRRLEEEAKHVAYLTDGDASGDALEKQLLAAKVAKRRVVRLPTGLCVEDLVDLKRYVDAVNRCLTAWPPNQGGITEQDLGASGRPAAVRAWCAARKIDDPSHLEVASEIVRGYERDLSADRNLTDPARATEVKKLYKNLLVALGIKSVDAALFTAR